MKEENFDALYQLLLDLCRRLGLGHPIVQSQSPSALETGDTDAAAFVKLGLRTASVLCPHVTCVSFNMHKRMQIMAIIAGRLRAAGCPC